jgi:hypothetical protein
MSASITVIVILNRFRPRERQIHQVEYKGQTLEELKAQFMPDVRASIAINAMPIERQFWNTTIARSNDFITMFPYVGKGQTEKQVISAMAMIAMAVAVGPGGIFGKGGIGAKFFAAGSMAATATTAAVVVAGGMLISSINADYMESKIDQKSFADMQQSYGFNPHTTQQQDLAKPVYFGKRRVYGNVICAWTEIAASGEREEANVIVGICRGPIKSISEIRLNEQELGNFKNIQTETRLGTIDQTALTLFGGAEKLEFRPNILVSSASSILYTTPDDDFDDLEVTLHFMGIYNLSESKGMLGHSVGVKVEVSIHNAGSWTIIGQETVTRAKVGSYWKRYKASGSMTISRGNQYDVRVTKTTADVDSENVGDDVYLQSILEVYQDGFRHPGLAHVGIKALAGERLNGTLRFSCEIEGSIVQTYNGNNRAISKITKASSAVLSVGAGHGFNVDEYTLIVGVRGMTQINNQVGRITATGATTITVNIDTTAYSSYAGGGSAYEIKLEYSTNPAWVDLHLATAPVISGDGAGTPYGVDRYDRLLPDRPDIQSLYNKALFCDSMVDDGKGGTEKRITWNGGWEARISIWDAICEVCDYCRSTAVWNGTILTFAVDQPRSAVNTHTIGNIKDDSFKIYSLKRRELAGKIVLDYFDETRDYKRTPYTVPNPNAGSSINESRKMLRGCVKQSEANRYGYYRESQNEQLKHGFQWEARVEAIPYEVGDVINVQHDIRNVGRIGEGTDSYNGGGIVADVNLTGVDDVITIDRDISGALDGGETYDIIIRLKDDTTETKTVKSWSGRQITIDGSFSGKPQQGDVWAMGLQGQAVEKVAIVNLVRTQKNKVTVVAVNYYGHDESGYKPELPAPNASSSSGQGTSIIRPPNVYEIKKRLPADALGIPNFDIPFTHNLQWNDDTPSAGYVSWSAEDGTDPILFCLKGEIYAITPGNTNNTFVYWDENYTTSFQNSNNENDAYGPGKWPVCINDNGTAFPCVGIRLLHAAIIRAGTIYAEKYAELRNTYVYTADDSLDSANSFEIPFKIVSEIQTIQSVKLSFKIMPYRAYSTAAASGGASTSGAGGGTSTTTGGKATGLDDNDTQGPSTPNTGAASGNTGSTDLGTHYHTMPSHSHGFTSEGTGYEYGASNYTAYEDGADNYTGYDSGGGSHRHSISQTNHRHSISSINHSHDLDFVNTDNVDPGNTYTANLGYHSHDLNNHNHSMQSHTHHYDYIIHTHDLTLSDHTHSVPNHTHGITYGIHEEINSPTVHFHIDNGSGYGAPSGNYTADQLDINITSSISGTGWKGVRFDTDLRCRIAAIIECKLDITA